MTRDLSSGRPAPEAPGIGNGRRAQADDGEPGDATEAGAQIRRRTSSMSYRMRRVNARALITNTVLV